MKNWVSDSRFPVMTVERAFRYYLDINSTPSQALLEQMANMAEKDEERNVLRMLAKVRRRMMQVVEVSRYRRWRVSADAFLYEFTVRRWMTRSNSEFFSSQSTPYPFLLVHCDFSLQNSQTYERWKFKGSPNLAEVLEEFPSVRASATLLMTQLPVLQQRYYSISSSLDMCPGQLHLTVAVVKYDTFGECVGESSKSVLFILIFKGWMK